MARALATAIAVSLLAVSGAGGADKQTPRRGGGVVVPAQREPSCLNPFRPCNFSTVFLGEVLEGAFEVGPDLTYRPSLVSRAVVVSRRPFVVDYRIRRDARWSDGVPVTASDFVLTHRIFRDYALSPGSDVEVDRRPAYRTIRRVVRVDSKLVRVVFREHFADWRTLFEHVLPQHVLARRNITAVWRSGIDDPRTGRPIGSGPFLFGNWERGSHVTLVRNRRYWRAHPAHLDRLVVRWSRVIPGVSGPADAIRGRHRDLVALVGADPAQVAALRNLPGVTVKSTPAPALEYLLVRIGPGGHPALKNKLVRQALAFGLNRNAIARVRAGDARLKADSAVLAKSSRFYRPTWRRYRFAPARAHRLLRQAGCRRGADAVYACPRGRLSLRFLTTANNPARQRTLELIQAQLRATGIQARIEYAPTIATLTDQILPSGDFDVALVNTLGTTARIAGPYCGGHDVNFTGYCNRLTNRDLVAADKSVDERQWARLLYAADAKLARDVPVIPLTALRFTLAHRSNIRGIVPNPVDPYWKSENWWLKR